MVDSDADSRHGLLDGILFEKVFLDQAINRQPQGNIGPSDRNCAGSTIGLEASYTETPIVQLGFNFPYETQDCLNLEKVLKFEHLTYMLDHRFPNTVADERQLEKVLRDILAGRKEPYLAYSKHLQEFADPLGVPSYKEVFLEKLTSL